MADHLDPIVEPNAAMWRIGDLFVRINSSERFTIGHSAAGSVDLDPQEAARLADMIENAARWLDRRIVQEDTAPGLWGPGYGALAAEFGETARPARQEGR